MNPANYVILSAILFSLGFYGVLVRRSAILILISVELMLAAVSINFVAFASYMDAERFSGVIFTIFVITIAAAEVWRVTEHDYPHALVRLHWCKVTSWSGDFEMREGQRMCWQQLPLEVEPVLPGALPVLAWLTEERGRPSSLSNR